jgi:hypothetical protein
MLSLWARVMYMEGKKLKNGESMERMAVKPKYSTGELTAPEGIEWHG